MALLRLVLVDFQPTGGLDAAEVNAVCGPLKPGFYRLPRVMAVFRLVRRYSRDAMTAKVARAPGLERALALVPARFPHAHA